MTAWASAAAAVGRDGMTACPTCRDWTELEVSEGEFWCPAEERAVTYGEVMADSPEDE